MERLLTHELGNKCYMVQQRSLGPSSEAKLRPWLRVLPLWELGRRSLQKVGACAPLDNSSASVGSVSGVTGETGETSVVGKSGGR